MQVRRSRAAILVLFSSGFLFAPVFGQTQRSPPVTVVADVSNLDDTERAIFCPDGQIAATMDRTTGIKLREVATGALAATWQPRSTAETSAWRAA
jgi:hypothetical protein